jgi:hypothetical protein
MNSPIAIPCSSGGNVSRRMAWLTVCRTPPPAPCRTRKAIISGRVRDSPQAIELAVNSTTLVR